MSSNVEKQLFAQIRVQEFIITTLLRMYLRQVPADAAALQIGEITRLFAKMYWELGPIVEEVGSDDMEVFQEAQSRLGKMLNTADPHFRA